MKLKVLIACEESQAVCKEFRRLGHEAYSCDLQECSGGHPEWHFKYDAITMITSEKWDRVISFPPCTDLAISGSRWFDKKRLSGEQWESVRFFLSIYNHSNCVENPVGIMNGGEYLKKWFPDLHQWAVELGVFNNKPQIIQPWMFGDGEQKATCLWIRGLPKLTWSNSNTLFYKKTSSEGREQRVWKLPPSDDRAKLRSKTFPGIARAMAEQWGGNINQIKSA